MQGSFQVAQATGTGNSTNSAPVRIYKLTKPLTDQAVVVNLGYDQKAKVDFSSIANEKITLVHIGEKLIILFDNQSTVTVEPFFDSRADGQNNVTIEMAPGRDVSVQEFASLFPISTDSSVLPAADNGGNSNGNAQASGANFSPFAVDPLDPVPTNPLAPQEEIPPLPPGEQPPGFVLNGIAPPPTISGGLVPQLIVDESFLTAATNGGVAGSGQGPAGTTVASVQVSFNVIVPGGQQSLTYALSISSPHADSGLIDSGTGQHVLLTVNAAGVVEGRTAIGGDLVFTVAVDATGHVTLTDLRAVHEGTPGDFNEGITLASGLVTLTATVTDNFGQSATATADVGSHLTILDDGPVSPTVTVSGVEPVALTFDGGLAGGNFVGAQTAGDTNPSPTVASVSFAGAFTFGNLNVAGADGGATTINYTLGFHTGVTDGSASGLTHAGSAIFLYDVGGVITGSTSATAGGINAGNTVFTLSVGLTTGVVTLTQLESIDHSQTDTYNGSYINDVKQLAANLIDLKASAITTDRDGDSSPTISALLDMGGNVRFGDDGPQTPTVTVSGAKTGELLTFDGGLAGGNFTGTQDIHDTNASATIATEDFSGAFTIGNTNLYGADGAGATTINYTVGLHAGVADGSASGLTHAGSTIFLYDVGGVITGSTSATAGGINAGNTVFTLSVGLTTGIVTLTQLESIDHSQTDTYNGSYINDVQQIAANLVDLTASGFVTDSEGDKTVTASASVDVGHQIQFGDDGPQTPTVTLAAFTAPVLLTFDGGLAGGNFVGTQDIHDTNASATIATEDFSGAFTIGNTNLYGADGPGATTINYTVGLHAGVADGSASGLTHAGSAIFLYDVGGVITGSTSATAGGINAGNTVFTLSVGLTTGIVTLTQLESIDHSQTDTYNGSYINDVQQIAANLVDLTASAFVTDSEGDKTVTASASVDVGHQIQFGDDGPQTPTVTLAAFTAPVLLTFDGGLPGGNFTGTQDIHDTNASATIATEDFSGAFTIGNTNLYGADGAGATTINYTVGLHAGVADGSASGLTHAGSTIFLYDVGGVITGSTSATAGGINAGNTVFTLSVGLTTGIVTLTQLESIDHTQTDTYNGSYINDIQQIASNLVDLTASAFTTDSEGDKTVTASASVDVGHQIEFGDDGPQTPTVTLAAFTAPVLLTFDGGLAGGNFTGTQDIHDTNASATIATEDFSGAFTIGNTNLYGADGPGATTINYTVGLHAGVADGSASGLTHAGSTIFLYDVGGVITGSTSATAGGINAGNTVFTLSVGLTTGIVTLTQLESIDHTQTDTYNGSYINDIQQIASNLVDLTASAFTTDSEGDKTVTASASVDVGHQIEFGDDGPQTPTVTLAAFTAPVLLTFDGGLAGGNFTGTQDIHDTNASATIATEDFSGAFTIGNTNLYGADGPGATTINYTVGLHAGVADGSASGLTHAGSTIFLYDVGGVITGSTSATAGGINAGNTVFTLSVGLTTGIVTLTQLESIDHSQTDTYNGSYINDVQQIAANLVDLTASGFVTDSEGDKTVTASASVDVGHQIQFGDDGPQTPTVTLAAFTAPVLLTFDGGLAGGNFVGTQDIHDTNASATIATEDFSGAFTIGNTNLYGADGPGATTINYTVGLHAGVADGSASGLTHAGSAIFLYDVGGVITGSTSATAGGINAGNTVFTLSVGLTTGIVTLTQLESIDHTQTDTYNGSYINDVQQIAANLVDLTASAFVTDSEGDKTVTASASVDVGHQIQFGDDGPQTPTVTLAAFTAPVLLTFDGGLPGGNFTGTQDIHDTNASATIATEDFSGAFTIGNTNLYGADGAGATTINYTVGLHAGVADGSASGLTHAGSTIFLYDVGGVITGSTSATAGGINAGNTVFTLSVGLTTGIVTLTQLESIDHSQTDTYNGSYINDIKQLAANLVDLTASAFTTDSEGDKTVTVSASVDVGHQIQFGDDGPQAPTASLAAFNAPVLLTFDGGLAGGNFVGTQDIHDTNASATIATEDFSGAFTIGNTSLYGADGAGSTTISYTLGLHTGVADGSASGLTHAGSTIFLYDVGGVITGSTSATAGGINAGNTVFTLSVGLTTGIVTLTQLESIDHSQTDTYNGSYINDVKQLAANLIDLTASGFVTDSEGDKSVTATASVDVGHQIEFGDDGPQTPTVTLAAFTAPVLLTFDGGLAGGNFVGTQDIHDTNPSATIATENFSGAFTFGNTNLYGADGAGATTINYTVGLHTGVADGSASGLTHAGSTIFLYDVGGVITGSTSATAGGINAGNTVFTLSVGLTTGIVTLTQLESIDHSQTDTYNGSYISDIQQITANLVDLTASAFTTDSEGDKTVTASASVDVGHQIEFGDDGPQTPTVTLAAFTAPVLLTFDGGLPGGNFVGTQDIHDTNPSATIATEDFSGAFTISNTNLYGADGAGATTINYTLGLHAGVANGSASGLTHAGSTIFLYLDSLTGIVTGSTSATQGGIAAGNTVFTLSVGLTTGIVTLTQLESIDHTQTDTYSGSYINDIKQLAANLIDLKASAFTTDSEGDKTVTVSASVDVGHQIQFGDDGPQTPTVTLAAFTAPVLLTFDGGLAGGNFTGTQDIHDTNASATIATEDFSGAFTIGNTNLYGADGAGATTINYTLGLHAGVANGSASGLTHAGSTIFLYLDGVTGVVTGSTSATQGGINAGNTVFTLSVGLTTGIVTLTQLESIDHTQTDTYSGSYINDIKQLAANLIDLKASAFTTDSEGDKTVTASASVDVGHQIQFGDDGPQTPTVTLAAFTAPVLLTFDGGLAGGNFTGTQDIHDTNPSATIATENFSGAFTIGNTNLYGADGAGATTINYTLGLHAGVANGSASGLTHAGSTIFLYLDGVTGVVTGSTSATQVGINAGNTVFTLSVGLTTGIVTLTQLESIDHTQTDTYSGSYINDIKQLAANLIDLKASAFTTDSEGDKTVTASASVDVGHQIQFGDDGPQTPTVTLAAFTAPVLLTFDGGLAGGNFTGTQDIHDTNASATIATENFSGAFTIGNTNLYGADGAGATTINYTLGLHSGVANGSASGLTHAGSTIFLYLDSVTGIVTGSTSATQVGINAGNTVFTLSVGLTTGIVTLTQLESIDHTQTDTYSGSYINDVKQLAANLIDLKASAFTTDSEGDKTVTASASVDVGHQIQFGDDGPQTPTVTLAAFTAPVLLTFDGGLAGGNFVGTQDIHDTNPSATIATENFSGAFTFGNTNLYGADGAGATTINYSIGLHAGVANGSASGLTHAGSTIFLYLDSVTGIVTGSTSATQAGINAGNTAFTLSVGLTTGIVTLTQFESIDHSQTDTYSGSYINDVKQLAANLIDLKASAFTTDSEGDKTVTASASIDIGHQIEFGDDGPKAPTLTVSAATVGVDETPGVQTVSGASDVLGSTAITFNGVANTVAGLFATVANAGTDTDVSSAVLDNGALSFASTGASSILTLTGGSYGADGPGTTTYALTVLNAASGLTLTDGTAITLSLDASGRIIGTAGVDAANPSLSNKVAFAIAIDPATGQLYVAEYLSLHQPDTTNPNDAVSLAAGKIGATVTMTDSDGDHTSASADIGTHISFLDDGPTLGAFVNGTLPNDIGSVNGTFAVNFGADGFGGFTLTGPSITGITYSTVALTDASGHAIGTELIGSAGATQVFDLKVFEDGTYTFDLLHPQASTVVTDSLLGLTSGHVTWAELADGSIEFFSAGFVNSSTQGFGVGNNFLNFGETFNMEFHVPGTGIGVDNPPNSNPQFVDSVNFSVNSGNVGDSVSWTATDTVHGTTQSGTASVDATGHLLIDPTISFNSLQITGSTPGESIRLTAADVSQTVLPSDQNLSFGIVATDGDGDHTTSSTLGIHVVAGDSSGNFTLTGGATADVIATSSHIDTIVGGGGMDIVDYRDDTTGVTVNLQTGTGTGGTAQGDTYSGIEGILGGSGNDTLTGLAAGGNFLDGGAGNDILNGGAGNDTFVLTLNGGGHDTINNFNALSDQIFVNLGDNLSIGQASTVAAANFHVGDETNAATWNGGTGKEFVFNNTTHELWYSASGTGADRVDLAHVSTGVPAAANVHAY